jgi:hypothetical protein
MPKIIVVACFVLAFVFGRIGSASSAPVPSSASSSDSPPQIIAHFAPSISHTEVRRIVYEGCEPFVATGPINGAATSNALTVAITAGRGCK